MNTGQAERRSGFLLLWIRSSRALHGAWWQVPVGSWKLPAGALSVRAID